MTLVLTGSENVDEWYKKESKFDIYHLIGVVNEFLEKMSLGYLQDSYQINDIDYIETGYEKTLKKDRLCYGGKIKSSVLKEFDIDQEVFVFTFNITKVKELNTRIPRFSELLKYPKMVRDVAFILDNNIKNADIELEISKVCSKLLKNIKLFDIFESDSLGKGKKSMAYQLEFYDFERTLTEEEVDNEFWKAIDHIKTKFGAHLRGE